MDPESIPDPVEKEPNSDRSSHLAYSHHANSDEEGLVKQIEDRLHDLDHNESLHLRDLLSGTLNKHPQICIAACCVGRVLSMPIGQRTHSNNMWKTNMFPDMKFIARSAHT